MLFVVRRVGSFLLPDREDRAALVARRTAPLVVTGSRRLDLHHLDDGRLDPEQGTRALRKRPGMDLSRFVSDDHEILRELTCGCEAQGE